MIVGRVEGYDLSVFGKVGGERAGEISKKASSSLSVCGGRKRIHIVVQNVFKSFLFLVYETTLFFPKRVVSF